MNLVEQSLINKFENDVGESISNVGGSVPYDEHWLPTLDELIKGQLSTNFIIDEKVSEFVDAKLEQLGINQDNIDQWQAATDFVHNTFIVNNFDVQNVQEWDDVSKYVKSTFIDQGVDANTVLAWNEAVDTSRMLATLPAVNITQTEINEWNESSRWTDK